MYLVRGIVISLCILILLISFLLLINFVNQYTLYLLQDDHVKKIVVLNLHWFAEVLMVYLAVKYWSSLMRNSC